jgi:hypothetical protein
VRGDDTNRRREQRLRLAEPIVGRFGSSAVVIVDLSMSGAHIEHYSRMERGTQRPLRVQWGSESLGLRATVVRSKIGRMIPGEQGITVYRSGLTFDTAQSDEIAKVRQVISSAMAATLVEQVANARGFRSLDEQNMPVFRHGILSANDPDLAEKLERYLPHSSAVQERGFIRMTLTGRRWIRKWTREPAQPEEGFTISADEPEAEISLLARAYLTGSSESRWLIRKLAEASLEQPGSTTDGSKSQRRKPV